MEVAGNILEVAAVVMIFAQAVVGVAVKNTDNGLVVVGETTLLAVAVAAEVEVNVQAHGIPV